MSGVKESVIDITHDSQTDTSMTPRSPVIPQKSSVSKKEKGRRTKQEAQQQHTKMIEAGAFPEESTPSQPNALGYVAEEKVLSAEDNASSYPN